MFSALRMLYTVRAREYQELPAFVESLMAGMRNTVDSRLAVTDNNRETVKAKLTKLLSANAFAIISKVEDLGSEGQRILYGSRVLTDLRPVFREAPSDAPVGLIVVHTIKLEYHTFDYKHEDIYIVASESELRDMQDAITRALKKSETLQATFRDTGIAFLDSGTKQ